LIDYSLDIDFNSFEMITASSTVDVNAQMNKSVIHDFCCDIAVSGRPWIKPWIFVIKFQHI